MALVNPNPHGDRKRQAVTLSSTSRESLISPYRPLMGRSLEQSVRDLKRRYCVSLP